MDKQQRLAAFERMLQTVQAEHAATTEKLRRLQAEGRERSATYRQLTGNKLQYQSLLSLYQSFGLLEEDRL